MRLIENTQGPLRHDWPEDIKVQGGEHGVVFMREAQASYRTAFVEAFPNDPATFLRGEGADLVEAEEDCWQQYQLLISCNHGPYERRSYTNGAGYCIKCGSWFSKVFDPLPEDPDREPGMLEKVLSADPTALNAIYTEMAKAQQEPKSDKDESKTP